MESRLPTPIREALLDNEMKSGFKLIALALSGLMGAGGAALLVYMLVGSQAAIAVGGGILILTAFTIFRALRQLDRPLKNREFIDRELLNALVAMDRRAIAISDLNGHVVTSNYGFEWLGQSPVKTITDLLAGGDDTTDIDNLIRNVSQFGSASDVLVDSAEEDMQLSLSGRRIGKYILWQAQRQDDAKRLDREQSIFGEWTAPIFEKLDCGVALEDKDGNLFFINDRLRSWLGLSQADDVPPKLFFKAEESQLLVGKNQRIDVAVIDVPLQTREQDRDIGRYRILRKADQIPGQMVSENREFLIDPIFDAAPIAVAVVSRKGEIKEYNQPFKIHPASKNVGVGDSIFTIVKKEDRDELKQLVKFAHDGKPASLPLDIMFNTQPERLGQIYSTSIARGEERYAILYLVDTTQEKSFERQFVQAQKMQAVGQLAGGVAHDFNNLLTAIIGFCDLLLVRHDAGDQSFSDIIQIKQNANRAANLVRQLLAFSRQQTLRPKVLMVTDILAEISNLIRRLIGENIDFKVVHGRDLMPVKVDQGQLEQVIINLAVNARDAMADGGKLEIRTSMIGPHHPLVQRYDVIVPDDYVLVEVADTGCGIPKDNLNKIFEPFFTTKEVGQGTGLGLATVYGIVKQTGGFVFVESDFGKGTNFLLFLRAYSKSDTEETEAAEAEAVSLPAKDLTGKGTILVVEDEDPVRLFACRALTNKGYRVLEAASGEGALEILEAEGENIDLLISDVIMPSMDGPTLVKEARKSLPDLPVIFVSGYAVDVFRKNLEAEEFRFLPKPFTLNNLAEEVKSILS